MKSLCRKNSATPRPLCILNINVDSTHVRTGPLVSGGDSGKKAFPPWSLHRPQVVPLRFSPLATDHTRSVASRFPSDATTCLPCTKNGTQGRRSFPKQQFERKQRSTLHTWRAALLSRLANERTYARRHQVAVSVGRPKPAFGPLARVRDGGWSMYMSVLSASKRLARDVGNGSSGRL